MQRPPPWLLGLDLVPANTGPLELAEWLVEVDAPAPLIGVHIVESGSFRFVGEDLARVVDAASAQLCEHLIDREALGRFALREVSAAPSAEEGLCAAAQRHPAGALILGRWSHRGARTPVKLGRIARRILRSLPCPVIVTPPELRRAELGDGPILLATDLGASSVAAARFAAGLARDHRRPLVVAHVDAPFDHAAIYTLDPSWEAARRERRRDVGGELRAWTDAKIGADVEALVVEGEICAGILDLAESRRSPMIVVGSRRLTLAARIFGSSTASTLAAVATIPVAVVPPPEAGDAG